MAKKKKRKNFNFLRFIIFLFVIVVAFFSFKTNFKEGIHINEDTKQKEIDRKKEEQRKLALYNDCLNLKYKSNEENNNEDPNLGLGGGYTTSNDQDNIEYLEEDTEDILNIKKEIDEYIKSNNYRVSVYYEDLTNGFIYTYDPDKPYYGCSLIKLVDALYLINKATLGEINLDEVKLTYKSKYRADYSTGMSKHKIGDEVSLRDLISYAITYSDNTAHLMLIDYIGVNNLKEYGKSLGGKYILSGWDLFGLQTASDTNQYLKEAYRVITTNKDYGEFLKNIMDNNDRNAFNTEDIKIYHKYGSYDINFHDIGLSLEEYPYAISIFTLHERSNYDEIIKGIHAKIRKLHDKYHTNREQICHKKVYEKDNND